MKRNIKNEHILLLTIIVLVVVVSILNSAFFSAANFIDIFRSLIVTGIMACGLTLVIISKGIDISFPAIAAFSMYATTKILILVNFEGSILIGLLIAGIIGAALGSVNAIILNCFKLPTLIVTLGTGSIFSGVLLTFIGSNEIYDIPKSITDFSHTSIVTATSQSGGISALPLSIIFLIAAVIITWLVLKYTMLGRGVYAIGGDKNSAQRAGFNINAIQFFIFCFSGALAGIAGLIHVSLLRMCNPFDILGMELTVIAAVVLGGVSITGGYGSIWGSMLGVLMITIINKSLIIAGVSSYWQQIVVGLLMLIGIGVVSLRNKYFNKSFSLNIEVEKE